MGDPKADLYERLRLVGLAHRADELLALASPSIRLGVKARHSETMVTRAPAPVWGLESGIRAVAGSHHNLALGEDGTVVGWGTTGMAWGDLGRLYYLIQPHHLEGKRLQASRCQLQSR